jgi:excisionase family DNA binding protein
MDTQIIDQLRGLTECARVFGLGRSTLNDLLRRGEVAYVRLPGGERKIYDAAVREWIERRTVRAGNADLG